MRIKKLELIGFKSFKDRTVIHFDAGITGIVGPNGCGKSNIIDALLWVMGEQSAKHLRGSSMEDVIFGGAEGYAPAGMAEVSVTLENDGGPFPTKYMNFSEVQATRKLHRSGESEYLINRETARLRDIQEIFMDTGAGSKGFSIVEQGAIGKIITAKPDDRRTLIEEAAGITKFKVRKRESQKKLELTDQNLVRLNDIVGELKRQLESLEKQARRAERYRELKTKLEDLDLWLSSRKFFELRESYLEAQKIFDESQAAELGGRTTLDSSEAKVQELQLRVLEKEKSLQSRQQTHSELMTQIRQKELDLQNYKFEVETARRNAQMQGSLRQESELRKEVLERESAEILEKLTEARELMSRIQIEAEQKDVEYKTVDERIREVDQELTQKRRELVATSQGESQVKAQLEVNETRLEEMREKTQSTRVVLEELKAKESEFDSRRKKLTQELEKERQLQLDIMNDVENFETNRAALLGQVAEKEDEVQKFKDNLNAVTSRLYGLENLQVNFEGFEDGVKNVMLWSRKKKEMTVDGSVSESYQLQPVSDVVEVDPQYEVAMEAALGTKLQMILSENSDVCLEAVEHLKENKSGRSSFYGATELSALPRDPKTHQKPQGQGVVALLEEVVRVPEKQKPLVAQMIGNVVIVDSIRTALGLRPLFKAWTFVTLDGDTLSADGVLTGGASDAAKSGLVQRKREIRELSLQKDEWAGKLALAQVALDKLNDQLERVQKDLEQAQRSKVDREIAVTEKKKDLERAEYEFQNLEQALSRQQKEMEALDQQLQAQEVKVSDFKTHLETLTSKRLEAETAAESLSVELLQARQGIDELRESATRAQVLFASKKQEVEGLERQAQMFERNLNEVNMQLDRMEEETSKNTESLSTNQVFLEEARVKLEHMMAEAEELHREISVFKNEYEEASAEIRQFETSLFELRKRQNELQAAINESQFKAEEAKMKEKYLVEQIQERYMIRLEDVAENYRYREGDVESAAIELDDLRDKAKRMGDVNLSAIEEYDDLVKRYQFLSQQQSDLVEAKEQLRKVIDRINRICSRRFKETFEAVNERFTKVFPVLFGGGEAKLMLVEDEAKDEMGIDIVARPPGKKPQSITLLSGGEKALTAVSLIFSIFLVKPSPFCLLDEVDAPLDDANVFRFNDLVREMAKRSQIIVVTHNKHTMEINEKLYGVTMQERGVSTMVSVDLKAAQAQAEAVI